MVAQKLWNMICFLESTSDITDAEEWAITQAAVRIIDKELLEDLEKVEDHVGSSTTKGNTRETAGNSRNKENAMKDAQGNLKCWACERDEPDLELQAKVIRMRLDGMTFAKIDLELGFEDKLGAYSRKIVLEAGRDEF